MTNQRLRFLPLLSMVLLGALAAQAATPVTTVILVRHAEKVLEPKSDDPPLTEIGLARAAELARVLGDSGIAAIYTTPTERTRKTAAPIAEKLGLDPIDVPTGMNYSKQIAKIIREKHSGQTVLVVGHSNTTPQVIRQLGFAGAPAIADSQHDDLFILTFAGTGPRTLVTLHYGAVSR